MSTEQKPVTEVIELPWHYALSHEPEPQRLWNEEDMRDYAAARVQAANHVWTERTRNLRSLLQQMLDVAENADETGYVTDVGFVDLDKLHAEARAALTT